MNINVNFIVHTTKRALHHESFVSYIFRLFVAKRNLKFLAFFEKFIGKAILNIPLILVYKRKIN